MRVNGIMEGTSNYKSENLGYGLCFDTLLLYILSKLDYILSEFTLI